MTVSSRRLAGSKVLEVLIVMVVGYERRPETLGGKDVEKALIIDNRAGRWKGGKDEGQLGSILVLFGPNVMQVPDPPEPLSPHLGFH